MKKILLLFLAWTAAWAGNAQRRDIAFTAGVNIPMYGGVESDVVVGWNYGQFFLNGVGFRAGMQWSPSVADVDHAFGVPLSVVWRTPSRTTPDRFTSGMTGAVSYGSLYAHPSVGNVLASFLMNLFRDMEFFAGITPGYVAGSSSFPSESSWGWSKEYWRKSWTEKTRAVSLALDAGLCFNYSIWRFDIRLMPSFHYNLTGNYVYHSVSGQSDTETAPERKTPLRWFFTLNGGLAYRF